MEALSRDSCWDVYILRLLEYSEPPPSLLPAEHPFTEAAALVTAPAELLSARCRTGRRACR